MKKLFAFLLSALLACSSVSWGSGVSSVSNYNPSAVAITGGTFTGITQGTISTGTGAGDAHFNINKTDAGSAAEIYFKDNNVAKWDLGAFNVGSCGAGNFAVYNYTMAALNVCIDSATGSVVMAGGINSTPIGATTASTGKFTTLQSTSAATFNGINSGAGFSNNGKLLISQDPPTIASGFGTGASISQSNGTSTFLVSVGTGGTASSGTITMPTAANGWHCITSDATGSTPFPSGKTIEAGNSITSIVFQGELITTGAAQAWPTNYSFYVFCTAY